MSVAELLCAAYISLALPHADVACKHMGTVVSASSEYEVEPAVMVSLIYIESRWTPTAQSKSNACGLTQVLPRYSSGFNKRFGRKLTCRQLFDPITSIKRGTKILSYYLKRYNNDHRRSLCAYNAGWSRCKNSSGTHKGYKYAQKVLKLSSRLQRKVDSLRQRNE